MYSFGVGAIHIKISIKNKWEMWSVPSRCLESNCRGKGGEEKTGKRLNIQVTFEYLL